METLIQILSSIESLTGIALYVALTAIILLMVYKTIVIGSVYSLIKFFIDRLYSYLITPKEDLIVTIYDDKIYGKTLDHNTAMLIEQQIVSLTGTDYIHMHHAEWLAKAIKNQRLADNK